MSINHLFRRVGKMEQSARRLGHDEFPELERKLFERYGLEYIAIPKDAREGCDETGRPLSFMDIVRGKKSWKNPRLEALREAKERAWRELEKRMSAANEMPQEFEGPYRFNAGLQADGGIGNLHWILRGRKDLVRYCATRGRVHNGEQES